MLNPQTWTTEERRALADELLFDRLPGPAGAPVSTTELGNALGFNPYERSVVLWGELDKLAKRGLVERTNPEEWNVRRWRLTPAGIEERNNPTERRTPQCPSSRRSGSLSAARPGNATTNPHRRGTWLR